MIPKENLMYGDLVRETYKGFNGNVNQCVRKVTDTTNSTNFHPIPITQDLLVKNGFKTKDNKFYHNRDLEIEKIDIKHYRITINEGQETVGLPFFAVHELQHVLKIYGIPNDLKL